MDSIFIHDIELWTHIGVPEEERAKEQCILVSVELFTDTKATAKSDDITKGTDYEAVTNDVRDLGKTERKTLECLVEDIAEMILKKYKPGSVKVSAWKKIIPGVKDVCVCIERQ